VPEAKFQSHLQRTLWCMKILAMGNICNYT